MKKIITLLALLCPVCCNIVAAPKAAPKAAPALWISGPAVPGGVQPLELMPDGQTYKSAGALNPGELYVQTTKKTTGATRYLAPTLPDALIANRGTAYEERTEPTAWQVPFQNDLYRFTVSTADRRLQGEIFQPWGELFLAGGATEVGWHCEGRMLLMTQDRENPCLWTWEGELRNHPDVEEPRSFKFMGQDRYQPKSIHPYRQGDDPLNVGQLRTGGDDTKWDITQDGRYRIEIDLFHETITARLLTK